MDTDSARLQPPIDTAMPDDICRRCGGQVRPVAGRYNLRQCMGCGTIPVRRAPLVIAGDDLIANIKAMAEFSERLVEIDDLKLFADRGYTVPDGDPSWAEQYASRVQDLAADIGQLELPGGDT